MQQKFAEEKAAIEETYKQLVEKVTAEKTELQRKLAAVEARARAALAPMRTAPPHRSLARPALDPHQMRIRPA